MNNTNVHSRCGTVMVAKLWKTTLHCMTSWTLCCLLTYWRSFIDFFQQYGLDLAHCWTLAGCTRQAAPKFTGLQLELITDPNIFLMVESAIRGGISTVSNRLAMANNKYLKSYDSSRPTSFIISWNVINLYGYCMLSKLPCSGFSKIQKISIFKQYNMTMIPDTY